MARLPGAFRNVQGLGAPLEIFPLRNGFLFRAGAALLAVLSLGAALAVAGWAVLDAFERYYRHGPAVVWRGLVLPVLVVIVLLWIGIDVIVVAARRWNKMVVIYEQGIAVRDRSGTTSCNWASVASLRIANTRRSFGGIPLGTTKTITLATSNGARIVFDGDVRGADEALEKIRARLLPILYERFEPGFEAGQAFAFGPIELQKDQGVTMKQKTLPWDSLQHAEVDRGMLQLAVGETNGKVKEIRVPVAEIPNLDLLMAFIRQVKPV